MKRLILTAGLILAIHAITGAQNLAVNTGTRQMNPGINEQHYNFTEDSSSRKTGKFDFYMKKSSNKKAAAWILLGGGTLCAAIGSLTFPSDYDMIFNSNDATQNQARFSSIITLVGIAAMLSSIPFFISSSLNRHKAHVGIGSQKTAYGIPVKIAKEVTGLTLSIPVGK
jgi:hypothetical protein